MQFHKELASGAWQKLSLMEQLGNIGSEVLRTMRSREKDKKNSENAAERALELFDLTIEDPRWRGRRMEIARAREVFCDTVFGDNEYNVSLQNLTDYFDQFAYASRMHLK